jgi:two-component system cell cycle response regulator
MDNEHPESKEILRLREMLTITGNLDPLTQIGNRRYLDRHSEKLWQEHLEQSQPLSCLLINLDSFRGYNDQFGHAKGDECLILIAQTLFKTLANYSGSLLARYGGTEFIVLLANTDIEQASVVAEEIREVIVSLEIPHPQSNVSNYVTVSLGVGSLIPTIKNTLENLIIKADEGLENAKGFGKNQVYVKI